MRTRKLIDPITVRDVSAVPGTADAAAWHRGRFSEGSFVAVKGADFRTAHGETLGVLGKSGSGKARCGAGPIAARRHPRGGGAALGCWQGR
jgi:ABC-type glutathione transport system ATPase component